MALIGSQAGMLARWQAREHGVPDHALRDLLGRRCWFRHTPGVYATFAGPLGRLAELWAALLYCSHRPRSSPGVTHLPDAVLSHETAAELYGFGSPPHHPIHVTIPSGRRCPKRLPGMTIHFSGRLDQSRHPALWPPRTRVDDTVIDLTQTSADLETAITWLDEACAQNLTTPTDLTRALATRPRVRHRADLTRTLAARPAYTAEPT